MDRKLSAVLFVLALAPLPLAADDWPQWRGPQRTGVSAEKGWLDQWPAGGPRALWKAEVGTGFSSVVVAKGRGYTLGNTDGQETVVCFDAESGAVTWTHKYAAALGDYLFEGGPTATPAVDGDRVFTLGHWGEAFCFEAATGKIVWSKNVQKETEAPIPRWGFGGSPLVCGELVIFNVLESGLALEKATGKVVWKSERKECGYSTPVAYREGDSDRVLVSSGSAYFSVEAKAGKVAWRIAWPTSYGVNAADPIVEGNRLFLSTGYGRGAALYKLGGAEPAEVWKNNRSMRNQMNASVLVGDFVYGIDGDVDGGVGRKATLKCVELATGAEKWSHAGVGSGSLTAADGKLIVLSSSGELLVAPASPEGFKPTARAKVLDGKCWTVPVLANGRVYARNADGQLVCLDVRKP